MEMAPPFEWANQIAIQFGAKAGSKEQIATNRILPRALGDSFQLVSRFGRLLEDHEGGCRTVDDANVFRLKGQQKSVNGLSFG